MTGTVAMGVFLALGLAAARMSAAGEGAPANPAFQEPNDVAFVSTADKSTQHYVELLPKGFQAAETHHLLVALHGHGSDRWQFIKQDRGECKGARDVAAKHGLLFISPDYRAATSWMGPLAEADVVQILESLRTKYKIGKVIVSGGSMGGTSALTFTALHPTLVDGVVSMNGTANLVEYPNFADAITQSYGGDRKAKPDEYRKRSAEFFPQNFSMPIAFTTGGKDTAVPPDSVLRLVKVLEQTNKQVLSLHRESGGHSTSYADTVAAYEFVVQAVLHPQGPGAVGGKK